MKGFRFFGLAWLTAGALDISSAFIYSSFGEHPASPVAILRGVASGPFGDHMKEAGLFGTLVGLGVHFALMANMTAALMLAAWFAPQLRRRPVATGLVYGAFLYLVMYFGVLPLRYPGFAPHDPIKIAEQLFSHLILVGLPMSLIGLRGFRQS